MMKRSPIFPIQDILLKAKRQLRYLVVPAERQKQQEIKKFLANPSNPFLVSSPRTGSHWLRMIMELYFQRPQLPLSFYYPLRNDYLIYHTHDMELDVRRNNVIYIYREPVETIYSQMQYHKESLADTDRILYWTELYAQHLKKWLIDEKITQKKALVKYEQLLLSPHLEFSKITSFFGMDFDKDHFDKCALQISKEQLKKKTAHDEQVVNLSSEYGLTRQRFKNDHSDFIWESLLNECKVLIDFFEERA